MQNVSEAAAMARSILHRRVRQLRTSPRQILQPNKADKVPQSSVTSYQHTSTDNKELIYYRSCRWECSCCKKYEPNIVRFLRQCEVCFCVVYTLCGLNQCQQLEKSSC
ncbi:hypothetical protein QN277_023540 [Acacia crassicarpa]|uniref:Uncharacterized protein n=1 Tax=Acacia crassicarpa TaxID=499986 RepID=A0AAE1JKD6_9FABA|nr:hypothetical protein QN277_023540 [Acacia crassicarpa]